MQIGIISDSHDHLPNIRYAFTQLASLGIETVIHCGDLISPFVTVEMGRFKCQVHTVFGNNDGDRFLLQQIAQTRSPNVRHHGEIGMIELDGRRVVFSHYEEHARGFALAHDCPLALFGHTHLYKLERVDGVLLVNPGELLGMKGDPSYCILDIESLDVKRYSFPTQPWPVSAPWQ